MSFFNKDGKGIVMNMILAIQKNKEYLSEVDGAIGDGDHGINMNKGFSLCETRIKDADMTFSESLDALGNVLFSEIGGSMGPLYGTLFMEMAEVIEDNETVTEADFNDMLDAAVKGLQDIVDADIGDKTLMDVLIPARNAMQNAVETDRSFETALDEMAAAAEKGRDYTIGLVAKYGRASRLGERSRGVLDAGAVSCALILKTMAESIKHCMRES